jgi:hypothetical protein
VIGLRSKDAEAIGAVAAFVNDAMATRMRDPSLLSWLVAGLRLGWDIWAIGSECMASADVDEPALSQITSRGRCSFRREAADDLSKQSAMRVR